eukprot:6180581-Pleurochrysis_carterae.AAC.1
MHAEVSVKAQAEDWLKKQRSLTLHKLATIDTGGPTSKERDADRAVGSVADCSVAKRGGRGQPRVRGQDERKGRTTGLNRSNRTARCGGRILHQPFHVTSPEGNAVM